MQASAATSRSRAVSRWVALGVVSLLAGMSWGCGDTSEVADPADDAGADFAPEVEVPVDDEDVADDGDPVDDAAADDDPEIPVEGPARSTIAAGHQHTCGLDPDGTPVCWGSGRVLHSAPPAVACWLSWWATAVLASKPSVNMMMPGSSDIAEG